MAINLVPILLVGGLIAFAGRKKKKRSVTRPALAPAAGRGTIFEGDTDGRPSGIRAKVGERFSITFSTNQSAPGSWRLNASPPDNSVKFIDVEHDDLATQDSDDLIVAGPSGKDVFVFEAASPGTGSLVFHWQVPWLEGKEPPTEIIEFLTEIS